MLWAAIFVIVLLYPVSALADDSILKHITIEDETKFKVTYSGIIGAIADEYVRFISKKWADDVELRYDYGMLSEWAAADSLNRLYDHVDAYKSGNWSDKRKYWWQYSMDWAPIPFPIKVKGPKKDVINVGPFRLTKKFKFKLKGVKVRLSSEWSFKFRPKLRFTSKLPFVSRVSASFSFTYRERYKKLFKICFYAGLKLKTHSLTEDIDDGRWNQSEGVFEFLIELPEW